MPIVFSDIIAAAKSASAQEKLDLLAALSPEAVSAKQQTELDRLGKAFQVGANEVQILLGTARDQVVKGDPKTVLPTADQIIAAFANGVMSV